MPLDPTGQSPLDRLPFASHPGVLSRLLAELGGAETVSADAARLFLLDPALALVALDALTQVRPNIQLAGSSFGEHLAELEPVTIKSLVIASASEQLAVPAFSLEGLETAWRKALATAHFARALAERSGYPGPDEAWLAGLLCWLPRFARGQAGDAEGAHRRALAALDRLPLKSFLPDALRYLNEPAQRLRDAAPLVRLAVAAYRQTVNFPAWIPALPHPDTLALAAPIEREEIGAIYTAMARAIDALAGENGFRQTGELARELSRMGRLELVYARHPQSADEGVHGLADSLASQEGLGHAIYLRRNADNGLLEGQPIGAHPAPPISIQPEGSTAAAAWALLTRAPVVVTLDAPADAAILDLQLIRQAGAEGLAALPIGAGQPAGVLIVCGSRQALSAVAANPRHYGRLGELAGRQPIPGPAATVSGGDGGQLAARVRQASREINNPVGIVKNYLAIMQAKLGDAAPVDEELRIVHEELDRIVRIMRGLTGEEPGLGPFLEQTDVNALIGDLVKVTEPSLQAKGVRVALQLDDRLPLVSCDQDKLKQIVLNLLTNALEATPPDGTVRVATAWLGNHMAEHFLEIAVADAGPGMPPELAARLFAPAEPGMGEGHAGVGLATVKALAQAMGGSVTFASNASGTTFRISLPAG